MSTREKIKKKERKPRKGKVNVKSKHQEKLESGKRRKKEKAERKQREKALILEQQKKEQFMEKYRVRRIRKELKKLKMVSLIPARGGSKGIKRKNIVNLNGYPLIAYTIMASLGMGIKNTYVSTEDQEIKEIAKMYGAKVIDRPMKLAGDDSSTEDVIEHFLTKIDADIVVLIQPTSPMVLPIDIEKGVIKFVKEKYDSLFSAVKVNDMLMWDQDMVPINYDPKNRMTRQTREGYFLIENGAFFVFTKKMFLREKCRFGGKIGYSEMPFWHSFQIDNKDDLKNISKLMSREKNDV
ncbi:MAG: cytidylyltransferase domain-containing protein [Candidatus Heimdallarchaeaceae archaeon]